jgi:hypothetical protein
METKKRGRGRPRKTETQAKPTVKGKRGRPKKEKTVIVEEVYDISTGKIQSIKVEDKPHFADADFVFTLHNDTIDGKAILEIKGKKELGMKLCQELYADNSSFRDFINNVIVGALAYRAQQLKSNLDTIL